MCIAHAIHFYQEQLRSKQAESESKVETPTAELMDFKTKFAETKAYAKVCLKNTYILVSL